MSDELHIEDILLQIKSKLNADKVQLWNPPYYSEQSGPSEEDLLQLAKRYSSDLNLNYDKVLTALRELQSHAVAKLKERDKFKETGIATIKIKIANYSSSKVISFQTELNVSGMVIKELVSSSLDLPSTRIKLISNGKVLKDIESLVVQGVKNGSQIMAVVLAENSHEIEDEGKRIKTLEEIKADTELLFTNEEFPYMQLEDQSGNSVNIPEYERKSLFIAMALHEKGRAALKKDDYSLALILLLEADKEFCKCNSQILNSVDNYALLNLDIAWCYLCLKSISQLPEAEERLRKCEESFEKSYGKNMERVISLKGTTGVEGALLMRLHLLQAIVCYHQNRRKESLELLTRAENELKTLKVDENSVSLLLELGFSTGEARLGLRATGGDVNAAVDYINRQKELRKESRKKNAEIWALNRERRKLGKCVDGIQYVEPKFVKMLQDMGYTKELARKALQQSNNSVSQAIQVIQDDPNLQKEASSSKSLDRDSLETIVNELVPQIVAAGFNIDMAKIALKKHKGNYFKAIEELLANNGVLEDNNQPSTSKRDFEEAFKRLSKDISTADDDYLDISLEQEEFFLNQYKSLLT